MLLDNLTDREDREWSAEHAVTNGWTRSTLEHHIKTHAHQRFGAASTNFDHILEPTTSDIVQQITKDPCIFDFLTVEPGHV